MRTKLAVLAGAASLLIANACGTSAGKKTSADEQNTILTELQAAKGKGILFGHQDDLAYGVGWEYIDGESDVKRVAGDYPALLGWELGGLELEHAVNLDSVPFSKMKELAAWGFEHGAINTFSWHPHSPIDSVNSWHGDSVVVKHILPGGAFHTQFNHQLDLVAAFFSSLKDKSGGPIPFIFRPWHEMDGDWFWWGSKACSPDELRSLFRYTIDYLRNKGLSQMVVAYSPDCKFNTTGEYLTWYPGDDMVDILGMDNYYDLKQPEGEKEAIRKLHLVIDLAKEKNKLAALTETGLELVPDSNWYSQKLGSVLNDSLVRAELSYAMVWRNDSEKHFFFPYPGQKAADDAKSLLHQPHIWLLNDFYQFKK
ncbi:glycoside hydrolase family 26 protein [Mangrovibacterium marinum]|uniref:Mannan endo-1,4-beta-mannosidase n=1 Tax=Mangrovibacterium marinum TaxID=1639118 RepID=A0A2T5C5H0_9BACT|nr:glycosyl hydrolase [Mangrovibacterium marinum]PTN10132.1 mannan endo-1,4-beta-mannosidase [Mangrovibacterium marinum]